MTETPRQTPIRRAGRALAWALLVVGLYVVSLVVSAKLHWGQYTWLQCFTHNYVAPGGQFQSLRRFREAAQKGPVQVVVFGSSHAYRGFDPRLFEAQGVSVMNLGSTYQTPLNTQAVAELYLPRLQPKLVIFEVYYQTLTADGLESARDLAVNTEASWPTLKMALATYDLGAIGFATAKTLGVTADVSRAEQMPQSGEVYVEGGYVEALSHRAALEPGPPLSIELREEQLSLLERVTRRTLSGGARVVWVMHPLPDDHRARMPNRRAIHDRITRAAEEAGVEYWDYDDRMTLDAIADFTDFHHLSRTGVAKFDGALLRDLRDKNLLP